MQIPSMSGFGERGSGWSYIKVSIEPGKLADSLIFSEYPLTVDPAGIKDIQWIEMVVRSKTIFKK